MGTKTNVSKKVTVAKTVKKANPKKNSSNARTAKKDEENVSGKYSFKRILNKILKDYEGIEFFSEENTARLGKALLGISDKYSDERAALLVANDKLLIQQLYAAVNSPEADKQNVLKEAEKTLLQKHVAESASRDLLSNLSLILFKADFFASEEKKQASKEKKSNDVSKDVNAYIAKISRLEAIPKANNVELATVSRKKVVVEKKQYKVGDLVVYVKPGTYVKRSLNAFRFLKKSGFYVGEKSIMGVDSYGIVVKPEELSITEYSLGDDVSKMVVNSRAMAAEKKLLEENSLEEDGPIDNQDIRHWKEKKFYNNVFSSKEFKEADFSTKMEIRRMTKKEAKMIKSLRKDAGLDHGCYITTAICEASGKPDDCYELTTLRNFRDNWLAKQSDGMYLINEYYETAPKVVSAINVRVDRNSIYSFLERNFLKKCLSFIRKNQMMDCKKCYMDMVQYCRKFLNK